MVERDPYFVLRKECREVYEKFREKGYSIQLLGGTVACQGSYDNFGWVAIVAKGKITSQMIALANTMTCFGETGYEEEGEVQRESEKAVDEAEKIGFGTTWWVTNGEDMVGSLGYLLTEYLPESLDQLVKTNYI